MGLSAIFEACRPRLHHLAYGMLGDLGEAEDIVQEAWVRFDAEGEGAVRNPEAWLVTVTTRLSIDHLRSARIQRETYVGPWLPEPVVTHAGELTAVEQAEELSMALLVVLERLSPVDRAVFLLRDVFDLEYAEIADAIKRTPNACRQIAWRARTRVAEPVRRRPVSAEEEQRVVEAFKEAASAGDVEGLLGILAEDANVYTDGGGVVRAAPKPIYGAQRVARFVVGVQRKTDFQPEYIDCRINGDPGFVGIAPYGVFAVIALEIADGLIANIRLIYNPDKLHRLQGRASSSAG